MIVTYQKPEKKSRKLRKNKKENCFDCWRFHVKWH